MSIKEYYHHCHVGEWIEVKIDTTLYNVCIYHAGTIPENAYVLSTHQTMEQKLSTLQEAIIEAAECGDIYMKCYSTGIIMKAEVLET